MIRPLRWPLLIAIVCAFAAPAPAQESVEDLEREIHRQLSQAEGMADGYFESALERADLAEAALRKLEGARPDHPTASEWRQRLRKVRETVDRNRLEELRGDVESSRQQLERAQAEFEQARNYEGSQAQLEEMIDVVRRTRTFLQEREPEMRTDAGRAFRDDVEDWLETVEKAVQRGRPIVEVRRIVHARDPELGRSLADALEATQNEIENDDLEGAMDSWAGARKLVQPLLSGRHAKVPEAQEVVARFRELEARFEKEVKPRLAEVRTGPLVEEAQAVLQALAAALDEGSKPRVVRARKRLAAATAELRSEWKDVPAVAEFLAECSRALARADQELPETRGAEQPAPDPMKGLVPTFEIDPSAEPEVRDLVEQANRAFDSVRREWAAAWTAYEDRIDTVDGLESYQASSLSAEVQTAVEKIGTLLETAERLAGELAERKADHPAVRAIREAAPRIDETARAFEREAGRTCDYAAAIYEVAQQFDWAGPARRTALEDGASAAVSSSGWPYVLRLMNDAQEKLAAALEARPDDHPEADDWKRRIEAWREEARRGLIEGCTTLAREAQANGDTYNAQVALETLREALPGDPAVAALEAELEGMSGSQGEAGAEVQERGDLLDQRAFDSAEAFRPKYDAWRDERSPAEYLSATDVLADLEAHRGKYLLVRLSRLGSGCSDGETEVDGEPWFVSFPEDLREACLAAMSRLDEVHARMVRAVAEKHSAGDLETTRAHYLEEVELACEIAGDKTYTPIVEVLDDAGNVVDHVDGEPRTAPHLVIRGVASTRYVIVPGVGNSLDAIDLEGVLP